mgnify:CR=1 FL=1
MSDRVDPTIFNLTADNMLQRGIIPTAELIAAELNTDPDCLSEMLAEWWDSLSGRLQAVNGAMISVPDVPSSLNKSFQTLWNQALQEAQALVMSDKEDQLLAGEESRKHSEQELKRLYEDQTEQENKYRHLRTKLEAETSQIQALEAEISVLKINLGAVTSDLKTAEQRYHNVEQEMALLQKKLDDSKRTFDQRVKDEQRHSLEQVSKAEADVRYYRGSLDKIRDESGRKESALTKEIHDLQAVVAKRDVKLESQKNQIKILEDELKRYKTDVDHGSRQLNKVSGSILSEQNKNKRLSDKVKELTEETKRLNQKQLAAANEATRREGALRGQVKLKDDELIRAIGRVTGLEKRITSQEEEIRRLKSRL